MNTLDLEQILNNRLGESKYGTPELDSDAYANIIKAMQDACNQILDVAVENVEIDQVHKIDEKQNNMYKYHYDDEINMYIVVDKESILKLKFK